MWTREEGNSGQTDNNSQVAEDETSRPCINNKQFDVIRVESARRGVAWK